MKRSNDVVSLLQALSDPTRLRLLNLLRAGELCVCYFVEVVGAPQPKISRHLAYLRNAGVVRGRRDGKWIHYSLERSEDPGLAHVLDATLDALADDKTMQRDLAALDRAFCGVR